MRDEGQNIKDDGRDMKDEGRGTREENKEKEDMKEEVKDKDTAELIKKANEYEAVWDKYVRVCAEFENARKRWANEREDLIKFANFSLLKEIITILDELEQALKITKEHQDFEKIIQGIELTYNNFSKILKYADVRVIEAEGKQFDPHVHEIAASREVEDDNFEHKVLEEVMKGYMIGGKVLRTSRVIIGVRKKTKDEGRETKEEKE